MAEKEEALRCLAKGKRFPPGNQRLINNANGPIGALIVRVVPDGRVIPDKFPGHRLVKLAADFRTVGTVEGGVVAGERALKAPVLAVPVELVGEALAVVNLLVGNPMVVAVFKARIADG